MNLYLKQRNDGSYFEFLTKIVNSVLLFSKTISFIGLVQGLMDHLA